MFAHVGMDRRAQTGLAQFEFSFPDQDFLDQFLKPDSFVNLICLEGERCPKGPRGAKNMVCVQWILLRLTTKFGEDWTGGGAKLWTPGQGKSSKQCAPLKTFLGKFLTWFW